ncbi:MAG TPA: 1,4-alpha-glucan branching enzyme, partial [Hyphomonas sp.]|nr:1,4-alpha-glucan branching enzyme [Hyphomonas sp.]
MKHSVDKHAGDSVSSSLLPFLGELDLHLIGEGRHERLADCLGAHVVERDGVRGVRFAVWAPNAMQVSVVGDFNTWDGTRNPMSLHSGAGVWETFVPGVTAGSLYKFELLDRYGGKLPLKADPLARLTERPPGDASVVGSPDEFVWTDFDWVAERPARQSSNAPLLIYEVHMGSWLRPAHEGSVWDHVGPKLIDYAVAMQFTHIELL